MSFRNLANVKLLPRVLTEPTHDETIDKITLFLAKSKVKAEAEEVEEFWNEIKSEAQMLAIADDLEMKARAEKEARVAREAREAIEEIEAKQAKERQEFWDKIKREAINYTSSDKAKEEREIREIEEKNEFWRNIHEEAAKLALREERYNELKEKHMELIKRIYELSKKEPIDYRIRSSSPHNYFKLNIAGYKRKSKHRKNTNRKNNRRIRRTNRRLRKKH